MNLEPFESKLTFLLGENWKILRYVLAVSGGRDSMVLWELFSKSLSSSQLTIAHFNHAQRAVESDRDELFVRSLSLQRGSRFESETLKGSKSDEATLRQARLCFLEEVRRRVGADFIVTAHHGQDQLETLLMRLLRGTGVRGLSGMCPKRGVWLKPLLSFSSHEMGEWAQLNRVSYREDASNSSETYLRNRVRRKIIPAILLEAANFGGEEKVISHLDETLRELREFSKWGEKEFLVRYLSLAVETPFWIRVNAKTWKELSSFEKGNMLEILSKRLGISGLTRSRKTSLLQDIERPGKFDIAEKFSGMNSCGEIYFFQREKKCPVIKYDKNLIECADLGLRFTSKISGLEARFFRPGDRLGSKKLSDLWLERRVPVPERSLIPLLALPGSNQIDWVFPDPREGISVESVNFPFSFLSP